MFDYNPYLGHPYEDGKRDCYTVIREIYRDRWGIRLPNFARPTRFWEDPNLDLYMLHKKVGFELVLDEPFEIGDLILMPYGTQVNSHGAVVIEDGQIIHHLPGQRSCIDRLNPKWARRANMTIRHPLVRERRESSTLHLHEVVDADILRNPQVRERIERAVESGD